MQRIDSFEKTLMLGKIEGRRRRGQQRMRWLGGINDSMDMSVSRLYKLVKTEKRSRLRSGGSQRVGHDLATEQQHSKHGEIGERKVKVLVTQSCPALAMGFSRQEHGSGLPFPSPGESSRPRDQTRASCMAGRLFTI